MNVARLLAWALAAVLAASCAAEAPESGPPDAAGSPSSVASPIRPATASPSGAPSATALPSSDTAAGSPTPAPTASPGGIVDGAIDRTSFDLRAEYDVDLALGYDDRSLAADETLTVTNTSGDGIDRLELNTIAARLGGLTIETATVDGARVDVAIDDQTLVVPLGGILSDGATTTIRLSFRATLRSDLAGSNWLFTRANGIVDAYRWLPWISTRIPFDRPNHGDPFVTPVSPRVTVRITTDRPMSLATTGQYVSLDGLTHTIEARNVRDFTITASPDYDTSSAVEGDTTVRVYYRRGAPAAAMIGAARRALREMEALVGPYPYPTFNVAQSAGGYGMEAPGLIWIPTGVGSANLSYLVTHETAHQWFYGLVGGDQANQPFTDEASADFLARHVLGSRRASRCETAPLDRSIYRYSSGCYYETVYIQGGNLLDDARRRMGDDAFWAGLRAWTEANRFGIASTRSLIDTLDEHTPLDLVELYGSRFPDLY